MSTYFYAFKSLEEQQYQGMLIFALIGLVWAAGWLLIGRVIPQKYKALAQWYVIGIAVVLGGWLITVVKG